MFKGAKAAVFVEGRLLCLLRDDKGEIDWPNHWDFPGGGREGAETPFETLAREVWEEVGVAVRPEDVVWSLWEDPSWFFVLRLARAEVRFGDEGQGWAFLSPQGFLARGDAIPSLKARLARYLAGEAGDAFPG